MLTKTLSEAKKKQRSILIKAMNNDIGSIDSDKDSWNPAQISERAKDIFYIRSLVDTWNPAQLNEALRMLDFPIIDTWNPAQIEEQRRNLVFYLAERTLTGNPITLNILGNLTSEVTGLKVTMSPIQDLHGYSNPWVGGAGKNKFGIKEWFDTIHATYTQTDNEFVITAQTELYSQPYVFSDSDIAVSLSMKSYKAITATNIRIQLLDSNNNVVYELNASADYQKAENKMASKVRFNWSTVGTFSIDEVQIELGNQATDYAPYSNICPISGRTEASVTRTAGEDEETKTHQYSETIYGGVDDFVNGGLSVEWGYIASYDGETLPGEWISDRDVYAPETTPTTGAEVAYKLATPTAISTSAEEITLLKGTNVLSTDGDSIELKYKQNF